MNTILRAAVHLGIRHEFEMCKELSLENNGTSFREHRKADQLSDRNHWHQLDQFPRFKVGIDKLYCTVELISVPLPKSMSSPTLCSVWEKWETMLLNPGERNSMVFGQQHFQRIESN